MSVLMSEVAFCVSAAKSLPSAIFLIFSCCSLYNTQHSHYTLLTLLLHTLQYTTQSLHTPHSCCTLYNTQHSHYTLLTLLLHTLQYSHYTLVTLLLRTLQHTTQSLHTPHTPAAHFATINNNITSSRSYHL
jgi:hypothetical protein